MTRENDIKRLRGLNHVEDERNLTLTATSNVSSVDVVLQKRNVVRVDQPAISQLTSSRLDGWPAAKTTSAHPESAVLITE